MSMNFKAMISGLQDEAFQEALLAALMADGADFPEMDPDNDEEEAPTKSTDTIVDEVALDLALNAIDSIGVVDDMLRAARNQAILAKTLTSVLEIDSTEKFKLCQLVIEAFDRMLAYSDEQMDILIEEAGLVR